MKIFELNIKKLGVLLLPSLLRRAKMVAWIRILFTPLDALYSNFLNKRKTDLYRLEHNGQKCYLRKALNDKFDPQQRRITIDDAPRNNAVYIFTQAENMPVYLDDAITIYTQGEYVGRLNFVVHLPSELKNFELEIKSLIDYYKLASKKYELYYE